MALLRRVYLPRELFENFLLKDMADGEVDNGALEAVARDLLLIASLILATSVPAIIVVPLVPALTRAADSTNLIAGRTPEVTIVVLPYGFVLATQIKDRL